MGKPNLEGERRKAKGGRMTRPLRLRDEEPEEQG